MKTTLSNYSTYPVKVLLIICLSTFGFTSVFKSAAQSVLGKWERTGTRIFQTDKVTGKQTAASAEMQQQYDQAIATRGYKEILEFKPANVYIITVTTGNGKPTIHNGNYSLSGDKLDMNIPLVKNEKTSITIKSIDSKTMIWDMVFMGKLTEIIYTKV